MAKPNNKEIKFGMFGGVFTPSVLTIIGVVLFLRTGWLVGEPRTLYTLGEHVSTKQMREVYQSANITCLFIRDSGYESAFV